jgi:hypothetical protein
LRHGRGLDHCRAEASERERQSDAQADDGKRVAGLRQVGAPHSSGEGQRPYGVHEAERRERPAASMPTFVLVEFHNTRYAWSVFRIGDEQ